MQWFMWRNPSCSNLVQSKFCWQLPFVHTDGTEGHGVFLVSNQRFELLDLCMVMFYGFYHGKSSLNHHLGEFFTFSEHLKQIQEFWWFEWCFHFGFRDTPLAHSDAPETFWEVERAHFDGRLATCVPKKLMTGLWFQIFFLCSPRKLGKIFTPFWRSHIFEKGWFNHQLGKHTPGNEALFGEYSHFDQYFSKGLKPPTRWSLSHGFLREAARALSSNTMKAGGSGCGNMPWKNTSWKLTYPVPFWNFKDDSNDFPFPFRGDMLVLWRVPSKNERTWGWGLEPTKWFLIPAAPLFF